MRRGEIPFNWKNVERQRASPEMDKLQEKCAIVGVFTPGQLAAPHLYLGLSSLQHRGQEASGITTAYKTLFTHKAPGLVSQAYSEKDIAHLEGEVGIGHNRYATSGTSEHLQPAITDTNLVALAHNGTLPQTKELEAFLSARHIDTTHLNDSEMMQRAIEQYVSQGLPLEQAVQEAFPLFTGAFSLVVMTSDTLIGLRDSHGIRPLSLGAFENGGYAFASETCGIESMGGKVLRDVKPGEMVIVDKNGMTSQQISEGEEKLDIFEIVYFARPDSVLYGKRVNEMRREMGKELARERTIDADIVIAVPNSSIPAAAGYAEESGIRYEPDALIKDSYTHRTFINPSTAARADGVRRKFIPIPEVLKDKSVIVIDDSIVRGTTSKELVQMLRDAGARKVHLVIASPPVKYPDFYGIATPTQKELIASHMSADEIQKFVGADSLQYLSYDGLIRATGIPEEKFNTSCFTGFYPIDIGDNAANIDFSV